MDPSFYPFASLGAPELGATTQQRLASLRGEHSDYSSLSQSHAPSGSSTADARFAGEGGWRHERRLENRQLELRSSASGRRLEGVGSGGNGTGIAFASGGAARRQLLAGSDTQSHIDLIRTATAQYKRQIDRQFMGTPALMARLRGRGRAGGAAASAADGGAGAQLRPINGGDRLPVSCTWMYGIDGIGWLYWRP